MLRRRQQSSLVFRLEQVARIERDAVLFQKLYVSFPKRPDPMMNRQFPGASLGFEWSGVAAAALSRGRKPMESSA